MNIGGHVSIAGGIEKAPQRGADIGANAIQIFASSPRSFKPSSYSEEQFAAFRSSAKDLGIETVVLHGVYLINIASIDADYRQASIRSMLQYLEISHTIGGLGLIFHPGFANSDDHDLAIRNIILSCQEVLDQAPEDQLLMIENSAGSSGQKCSTLEELAQITQGIDDDRLRFCLDTQHTFAAGFDLRTKDAIDDFVKKFDAQIGWQKVSAIHCNDSKTELGSHVDRHENIGQGKLGLATFRLLVNHDAFKDLPFILEVPGTDKKGPDKANVNRVRGLIR